MARFKVPANLRIKVRNETWTAPATDIEVTDPDVINALRLNKMAVEIKSGDPAPKPETAPKPEAKPAKAKRK